MSFWQKLFGGAKSEEPPIQKVRGNLGERAAKKHLQKLGLKFLAANYRSGKGEIDLVFQEADCLVFAEVKTSTEGQWMRPAARVNLHKRRLLAKTALAYLKEIHRPQVRVRFDIVEVLLKDDEVSEIRHLPNSFVMPKPYRYP